MLGIIHDFDLILRELSGMDQFIFQAGGGADAAYTMTAVARAYWKDRGMLGAADRDGDVDPVRTPATRHGSGGGLHRHQPALGGEWLSVARGAEAAVGPKTALVMMNNPDDMGIYNPEIKEWVRVCQGSGCAVLL